MPPRKFNDSGLLPEGCSRLGFVVDLEFFYPSVDYQLLLRPGDSLNVTWSGGPRELSRDAAPSQEYDLALKPQGADSEMTVLDKHTFDFSTTATDNVWHYIDGCGNNTAMSYNWTVPLDINATLPAFTLVATNQTSSNGSYTESPVFYIMPDATTPNSMETITITPSPTPPSRGLSKGAEASIIVGWSLVGLLLILGAFVFLQRRRKEKLQIHANTTSKIHYRPELEGKEAQQDMIELGGAAPIRELDGRR